MGERYWSLLEILATRWLVGLSRRDIAFRLSLRYQRGLDYNNTRFLRWETNNNNNNSRKKIFQKASYITLLS